MSKSKYVDFTDQITEELVLKLSLERLLERQEELIEEMESLVNNCDRIYVPLRTGYRISIESFKRRFNILVDELAEVQELLEQLQDPQ